jgi:phytoene dehydrogenase-like protein
LRPYLQRDETDLGGALVVFLGVPENEVDGQSLTHHQVLVDYRQPLGNGNNLFISVSAPGDTLSAPSGYRAVMVSTHCELTEWESLTEQEYERKKTAIGQRLLTIARRVYPNLGAQARILEVGTPCTYARYTHRYRGAVGGIRLTLRNSNLFAVPYNIGVPGFWQAGDTTWPGLGTVACVLGSRHVADGILHALSHQIKLSRSNLQAPVSSL